MNNNVEKSWFSLHFFFDGKLGREEATSAFLATLLEQQSCFRTKFFNLLDDNIAVTLSQNDYEVVVEEDGVDIKMYDHDNQIAILIENKIQGSSKRPNQINEYYNRQRNSTPTYKIIFVFLTPNVETGKSDLRKIKFLLNDFGFSIGWQDVLQCIKDIPAIDQTFSYFIESSCVKIEALVKSTKEVKYPNEGDREILNNIARQVKSRLTADFLEIGFQVWTGEIPGTISIFTTKSNFTIATNILFETENEHPHAPKIRLENQLINCNIETTLRISSRGKKSINAKSFWLTVSKSNTVSIEDAIFSKDISGKYCKVFEYVGNEEELSNKLYVEISTVLHFCKNVLIG